MKKITKPKSQPAHVKVGAHPIGHAGKSKLRPYGASSFSGRPFNDHAATPPQQKG